MPFVVDASLIGAWILPEVGTPETDALLARTTTERALAPDLLWHEMRSLIVMGVRRGRVPESEAMALLNKACAVRIANAGRGDGEVILRLALTHKLSAYDAAYLALAKSEGLPLATLDRRLGDAAEKEGVGLA
jgi:predicted nucleic acid-binding protein